MARQLTSKQCHKLWNAHERNHAACMGKHRRVASSRRRCQAAYRTLVALNRHCLFVRF